MDAMWMPDSPILRLAWLKRLSGGGGGESGEPVYKTISGNPVTFDAVAAPLQQLRVDFSPVQAGSGDPSPTNIRPISGWTGLTATVNGAAVPVAWQTEAGTVYGGYADLVSGALVAEFEGIDTTFGAIRDGNVNEQTELEGGNIFFENIVVRVVNVSQLGTDCFCNICRIMYEGNSKLPPHFYIPNPNPMNNQSRALVYLPHETPNDTRIQIVAKLATPIHYQLTPQTIRTIRGSNTISSDGGTMTVTYRES